MNQLQRSFRENANAARAYLTIFIDEHGPIGRPQPRIRAYIDRQAVSKRNEEMVGAQQIQGAVQAVLPQCGVKIVWQHAFLDAHELPGLRAILIDICPERMDFLGVIDAFSPRDERAEAALRERFYLS
jgi:hypothetical protein